MRTGVVKHAIISVLVGKGKIGSTIINILMVFPEVFLLAAGI